LKCKYSSQTLLKNEMNPHYSNQNQNRNDVVSHGNSNQESAKDSLGATSHSNQEQNTVRGKETILRIVSWNPRALNTHSKCLFALNLMGHITMYQEIWSPHQMILNSFSNYDICNRPEGVGGGSLLCLNPHLFTIQKSFMLNDDSKLYRVVLHNNKILWLGNIYLNKGKATQLNHVFTEIIKNVPPEEYSLLILGGDWNINIRDGSDARTKLILTLAKQLKLQLITSEEDTRFLSLLDFFLVGSSIKFQSIASFNSPSDHQALVLEVGIPFPIAKKPVLIPNSKLAADVTSSTLIKSNNSLDFLQAMGYCLRRNNHRVFTKVKRQIYHNDLLDKTLQLTSEEDLEELLENHYKHLIRCHEVERFSIFSKTAFSFLKKFTRMDQKRRSIVSSIKDESGVILSDPSHVNEQLILTLKEIQLNPYYPLYDRPVDFPKMLPLTQIECKMVLEQLSSGKAVAMDLMSDTLLSKCWIDKSACVFNDLWSICLDKIKKVDHHFFARVIPLNKIYPALPTRKEFRPIVVMSVLVKILEARLLPKLREYLKKNLIVSQTGFVPNCGTTVNVVRAIERIKLRTSTGKNCYGLFIDLKNAYNTVIHELLFKILEPILESEEIQLIQAIWSRLKIFCGKEFFIPNVGVAQGSVISPALFDIYLEPILKALATSLNIDVEDLLAYADDILIIVDSLECLKETIDLLRRKCREFGLVINDKKSAVVEFIKRRGREKRTLLVGTTFEGIPVLKSYKYLGLYLDNKLSVRSQLQYIEEKVRFISYKFYPLINTVTAGYRKNLWSTFIKPLFELLAILYVSEPARSNCALLDRTFRKSFQSIVKIGKTTPLVVQGALIGTNLSERGASLWRQSQVRWECRKQRSDPPRSYTEDHRQRDLLKFAPREVVELINLMNHLCPSCRVPLSSSHLASKHGLNVPTVLEMVQTVDSEAREIKSLCKANNIPINRVQIIENVSPKVQGVILLIRNFLKNEARK